MSHERTATGVSDQLSHAWVPGPRGVDDELRHWWGTWRGRSLRALRHALGCSEDELLRRLGVKSVNDLRLPPKAVESSNRPIGKPRREIDRDALFNAMKDAGGKVREAARALAIPRTTLQDYLRREPVPEYVYGYDQDTLSISHRRLLARSGVSRDVARARGYISSKRGLDIPIWNVRGHQMWVQTRVDEPRSYDHRYINSGDAFPVVDVSPFGRHHALDAERTLYVAESPRKADAAVSLGLACVAVQGCRMISYDEEEWGYLQVDGRSVVIAFDGDAAYKPDVRAAERRLWEFLTELGGSVRGATLPEHMGLDDFLASGRSLGDLDNLVAGYSEARGRAGR